MAPYQSKPPPHLGMPGRGKLWAMRRIVSTGETRAIDGLPVSVSLAALLLYVHERLPPHGQEEFAADCNTDFWEAARKWLAQGDNRPGVYVVLCTLAPAAE